MMKKITVVHDGSKMDQETELQLRFSIVLLRRVIEKENYKEESAEEFEENCFCTFEIAYEDEEGIMSQFCFFPRERR